ncbi:hypothetical protein PYJP_16480 [Pyrofollis japonicus]|uniref:hypothetical protein n=1 Tax=Pyrofollis japonicus TaxID=3060460 RepID=UPI00295B4850|nr:hypothetical protein [Pyrofollis japonicus]BEP18296.1 hypothetical protein PYJP_16480 [Pyrofollis japonicus]
MYKNKTIALTASTIAVLAISVLAAYAMWSQQVSVTGTINTGELDWEFVGGSLAYMDACGLVPGYGNYAGNDWNASYYPEPGSIQLDKDAGCTNVTLLDTDGDGDYDALNITLHNVYPWYYTHIAFKAHNNDDIPLKIWRVTIEGPYSSETYYELNEQELQQGVELDLTGDNQPDITVWWGDNFGTQLHYCQSADISLDITVLQTAPQGSTLSFIVKLDAIAWNEYTNTSISG